MRLTILFASVLFIAGCSKSASPAQTAAPASEPPSAITAVAKLGEFATDPVTQFSLSFEGNPAPEEIREKLEAAMKSYGLEINDTNTAQAGNALIALRKEKGHSEIAILDKMLAAPPSGTFQEAAERISSELNQ